MAKGSRTQRDREAQTRGEKSPEVRVMDRDKALKIARRISERDKELLKRLAR